MPDRRVLYRSPNGDSWSLARDQAGGPPYIIHEANEPSGGRLTNIDLGEFLRDPYGPEHKALLHLIGTLVEASPHTRPQEQPSP
jgi:hypothetical protein